MMGYRNSGDHWRKDKIDSLEDAVYNAATHTWREGSGIESQISEVGEQVEQTVKMMAELMSTLKDKDLLTNQEVLDILDKGSGSWEHVE